MLQGSLKIMDFFFSTRNEIKYTCTYAILCPLHDGVVFLGGSGGLSLNPSFATLNPYRKKKKKKNKTMSLQ